MKNLRYANQLFRRGELNRALSVYQSLEPTLPSLREQIKFNINLCSQRIDKWGGSGNSSATDPLVSVIVPTHNVEKFIDKCLLSIRNQLLKNIEIIIVDDGSSDRTIEIIEQHEKNDGRIVFIRNGTSSGNSGTPRNQGIVISKGEYLCFVDSDDWIDPTMLEELYATALETRSDVVSSGGFYRETSDGKTEKVIVSNNTFERGDEKGRRRLLLNGYFPIVWYRIYKREFVINRRLRFGETKTSADLPFAFKALIFCDSVAAVKNIYYHYRFDRPGSTIERRKGRGAFEMFIAYQNLIKFLEKEDLSEAYLPYLALKSLGDYTYNIRFLRQEFWETFRGEMAKLMRPIAHKIADHPIFNDHSRTQLNEHSRRSITCHSDLESKNDGARARPSVSVIVPAHNVAAYVRKCIESLKTQTLKNLELIVVDDGSTDDTSREISDSLPRTANVRRIRLNKASGNPATPRNLGIAVATGKYIGFVDSDDWVEPHMFESLYDTAERTSADIVSTSFFLRETPNRSETVPINYVTLDAPDEETTKALSSGYFSNVWNRIYRRDLINDNGIYFPTTFVGEDLCFSIAAHLHASVTEKTSDGGYHYRFNRPASTTDLRRNEAALKSVISIPLVSQYLNSFSFPTKANGYVNKLRLGSILYTYSRMDAALKQKFLKTLKLYEFELSQGFDLEVWTPQEIEALNKLELSLQNQQHRR